jgi:hydroxymethylbilane synthase
MSQSVIRIGTRGSPLALAQAHEVAGRLATAHGMALDRFEIVVIRTSGDRIQDRPLSEAGGKGLFTKEIEDALIDGRIDLAVHSMKDMPTVLPDGLDIVSLLPRADVRDAFISLRWPTLAAMPAGARIGTSSLRRSAQIRRARPDLEIVPLRGNVQTRLRKLAEGEADATLLAVAGLDRLGMTDRITSPIPVDEMLPAVAQGAIGIEIRSNDPATRTLVSAIDDAPTAQTVGAERAFLARLEGSCRTPIAALARLDGETLHLRGEILSPDGRTVHSGQRTVVVSQAIAAAIDLADELLAAAGPAFFEGLS